MWQIRIFVDGHEQAETTATPEPPADLQAEIARINAALCDAITRIAKIEGEVRRLRNRLIDNDAEEQVP